MSRISFAFPIFDGNFSRMKADGPRLGSPELLYELQAAT